MRENIINMNVQKADNFFFFPFKYDSKNITVSCNEPPADSMSGTVVYQP